MGRSAWLLAVLVVSGCATKPSGDAGANDVMVTRDSVSTVWSTPAAEAALKAAADAERAARARGRNPAPVAPAAEAPAPAPAEPSAVTPPSKSAELPLPPAPPDANTVNFAFDRDDIEPAFQPLVERHGQWLLADRSRRLILEGHADDRGGAEYNLALGQRRAQAVARALALMGVAESQFEAVSFGDTRPLDRSRSEEAFARNRRVEFRLP